MLNALRRLAPAAVLVPALLGTVLVGTASAAHVSCGQTITQNTVLDSNVGPCPDNGIIIGANNITLDLNGHAVFGTSAPEDGAGILLQGRTGVTVTNGQVMLFDGGVVLEGGSGNTVTGIVAQENIGTRTTEYGDGIALFASSGNTIIGNVTRHNGPYSGISLVGNSDNNVVSRNVSEGNNIAFDQTGGGPGLPTGTMDDHGIRVEGPGVNGNRITNNVVSGNGLDGILVFGFASNTGNIVTGNTARGNGFHNKNHRRGSGIIIGGGNSVVERNTSQSNAASGIRVNSTNNTIRSNTATNNALSVNQATLATGGAFDLLDIRLDCDNNVWQGNTYGTRNTPCIN